MIEETTNFIRKLVQNNRAVKAILENRERAELVDNFKRTQPIYRLPLLSYKRFPEED